MSLVIKFIDMINIYQYLILTSYMWKHQRNIYCILIFQKSILRCYISINLQVAELYNVKTLYNSWIFDYGL